MYDRKVPTENPALTLLLALVLWGGAVAVAAAAGVFSKFTPSALAAFGGFAFAFATASYYLDRAVRDRVDSIDLRVLAALNLWRFPLGVAALVLLLMRGTPRAHFYFHVAGLADLLLVVTLGYRFALEGDVAVPAFAGFAMMVIALFAVPLSATLHVAALDRLARQKAWKALPASTRISSVSPFA